MYSLLPYIVLPAKGFMGKILKETRKFLNVNNLENVRNFKFSNFLLRLLFFTYIYIRPIQTLQNLQLFGMFSGFLIEIFNFYVTSTLLFPTKDVTAAATIKFFWAVFTAFFRPFLAFFRENHLFHSNHFCRV